MTRLVCFKSLGLMAVCLLGICLTICPNCEKGTNYMLKDVGQIKISGGCEVFAEGCITFVPIDRDETMVKVDNSGLYFYDEVSNPIPSFELKIDSEQLAVYIKNWIELNDSIQKKSDYYSTRNATVSFDFLFHDGNAHYTYSENSGGYQLDSIIDSVEAFVAACQKRVAQSPLTFSEAPYLHKNKTEEFLGSPEERDKVVLQFNDMSGLHGGCLIVVTGKGNVLVQIVSHDNERDGLWGKGYSFDISHAELSDIFAEVIKNDIITIQFEERAGIPDETRVHFSMTNGKDDFFKLETWEQADLTPDAFRNNQRTRFDKACLALKRLEHIARTDKTPVQEGPYLTP